MDYSIFLIHRYEECLKENPDRKEAMVDALCKSTSSIASSGLTTVIGFFALLFMRFGIGSDLGRALAKGVAISLICVFIFMPVLILETYPMIQRTHHKRMLPSFTTLGKVVRYIMIPMVCIFAVLMVPFYLASNHNSYYYGASKIFGLETQSGKDAQAIEDVFGKSDTYAAMVPNGNPRAEKQLNEALKEVPEVKSIVSYVNTVGAEIPKEYLDDGILSQLVSENYSRMVLTLEIPYEGEETFNLVEKLRRILDEYYPGSAYLAGEGVSSYDLTDYQFHPVGSNCRLCDSFNGSLYGVQTNHDKERSDCKCCTDSDCFASYIRYYSGNCRSAAQKVLQPWSFVTVRSVTGKRSHLIFDYRCLCTAGSSVYF